MFPNHRGTAVNMIKIEDEWAANKTITKVNSKKSKKRKKVENIKKSHDFFK